MPSEFQDFLNEGMAEAADPDTGMGVVFVVSGKNLSGVPAPLTVDVAPSTGQAQRRKTAWAIMVPLPAPPELRMKGTKVTDLAGRVYKVFRWEEKRMCLEVFVMDINH